MISLLNSMTISVMYGGKHYSIAFKQNRPQAFPMKPGTSMLTGINY